MPKRESSSTTPNVPLELVAFRKAKGSAFFRDAEFGEVQFLVPNQRPAMAEGDTGEGLPWDAAVWVAQEADGAVLGYLSIEGVDLAASPVVRIDNEGSVAVTGLSLVDHFALQTSAGRDGEIEPLLAFCRKNGLDAPRSAALVNTALATVGLDAASLSKRTVRRRADLPRIEASAWLKLVEASRATAPPAPAKKAAPKAAKKGSGGVVPLDNIAYGCVGPDGAPWFTVRRTKDAKQLVRFVDDAFQVALPQMEWTKSLASLGDTLFTLPLGRGDAGGRLRHGEWERFLVPEGDGNLLLGDGRHALYCVSGTNHVYAWDGEAFAAVPGAPTREYAAYGVDASGALYILGGKTDGQYHGHVTRVHAGTVTELPKLPAGANFLVGGHSACVAGGVLVAAVAGGGLLALTLGADETWRGPLDVKDVDRRVPLADGDVLLVCRGSTLQRLHPRTMALTDAGQLLLRLGAGTTAAVPMADGRVVFVGGTLNTKSTNDPLMLPQLWNGTKVTPVPGCEADTEAQVKEQTAKFRGPVI